MIGIREWLQDLAVSPEAAAALVSAGEGYEMPLVCRNPARAPEVEAVRGSSADILFPAAYSPQGALAGLWLYLRDFEACHRVAQDLPTPEGSYWHGILHRQEPDDWNAGYWFRATGPHPVHTELLEEARALAEQHAGAHWKPGARWDAENFVRFCARARREPGSEAERLAKAIQMAEWRLLFRWCARVRG